MKFQRGSIFEPKNNLYKYAGIFLIIGTIQYILAVNISEAMFPGYNDVKGALFTNTNN